MSARLAGLWVAMALAAWACGSSEADRLRRLRAQACPDGGCVSVQCPDPATVPLQGTGCPGNGTVSWLKDDVTGACCEFPCWAFGGPGFTRFDTRAECESPPACDGVPVGAVLPSGDGCNTCSCVAVGRWDCTQLNCAGGDAGRLCGYWQGGCPADQYCAFEPADSCSDGDRASSCLPRASSCSAEQAPVCGCDNRDYESRCLAGMAGTGIRRLGRCAARAPCDAGADCLPSEYCPPRAGASRCEARPLGCVNELAPVCGADGRDYGNPCLAAQAGVDVRQAGLCP